MSDILNVPLEKIAHFPVCWITQKHDGPKCRRCSKKTHRDDALVEMHSVQNGNTERMFVCLECAQELFEEMVKTVRIYRKRGVDGVKFMKEI